MLRDLGLGSGPLCPHHVTEQVCPCLPSSPTSGLMSGLHQEGVQTVATGGGTWALLWGSFAFQHFGSLAFPWERAPAPGPGEAPQVPGLVKRRQ